MTAGTKSFIFEFIRDEFNKLDWDYEHIINYGSNLIKATIDIDLIEEAKEMISDAKEYGYDYTNLLN